MITKRLCMVCVVAFVSLVTRNVVKAQPFDVGTAFTYQGQLKQSGVPVNVSCDFEFSLWDDPSTGTQKGTTQSTNVSVDHGLFAVPIDFGISVIDGNARWLKIDVCCAPNDCTSPPTNYATLSPRQELTPAPYSIRAGTGVGGRRRA